MEKQPEDIAEAIRKLEEFDMKAVKTKIMLVMKTKENEAGGTYD